jgi:hypothetical protein
VLAPLRGWDNFYVIVGSAAAGLTGLTFVVIALVADSRRVNEIGLHTFITPTVVHFATVLALSAFLCVPRQTLLSVGIGLGIVGLGGLIYSAVIAVNMHYKMGAYVPVLEDWVWHVLLPALTYGALCALAWLIQSRPELAEYGIGGAAIALLFIGIHNAWDIAIYTSLRKHEEKPPAAPAGGDGGNTS